MSHDERSGDPHTLELIEVIESFVVRPERSLVPTIHGDTPGDYTSWFASKEDLIHGKATRVTTSSELEARVDSTLRQSAIGRSNPEDLSLSV